PDSLVLNSQMYSNYKSRCTVKSLIGITPHGTVSFVSLLFTGNASDCAMVRNSCLFSLRETSDSLMADKGFLIARDLQSIGCTLNIPHFMNQTGQFTPDQIKDNRMIASVRFHMERAIHRIKTFALSP
ncbi:hypothetical protein CAPTEDRAFT_138455, partial [Capitella teleta]